MKKSIFTLLVAMLLCGNVFAQDAVILIEDDFEAYTVGGKIAQTANAAGNDWWTTWGNAPGSSEDGVVAELGGTKCGYLTYGTDQVILLGDEQSGVYDLEFDILVPQGKNGYFNILHDFAGSNSEWAMQCHLHLINDGQYSTDAPGRGTIHAGSNGTAEIVCYYDQWMHFRLHINTDTDVAEYYYTAPGEEEALVCTWQWSLDSFGESTVGRTLAAMDFFPPENAATSEYYIDNFKLVKIGGDTAADLTFNPSEINETVAEDGMTSVTISMDNTGTSIAEYSAYVDYGMGEISGDYEFLSYAADPITSPKGVGWIGEEPLTFEIANYFPASAYGNSVMGTYITQAMYAFFQWEDATGNISPLLEAGTDVIFRIYSQGVNGLPGEVLAEKAISSNDVLLDGQYTAVIFDEPVALTGFDVYVAVEMTQAVDGTTMNLDGGQAYVGVGDLYRQNKGAYRSLTETAGTDYGNWCLAVVCEGTPVAGGYATLDKTYGSVAIGASDEVTVNLNSFGLEKGVYESVVKFITNVPGSELVEIPLTLTVGGDNVTEMSDNAYSIYPNPTSGKVMIEGENISYIAIYGTTGQLINVVMNNNVVDMTSYENGVYFFNVVDNAGQSSVQRVVVAK